MFEKFKNSSMPHRKIDELLTSFCEQRDISEQKSIELSERAKQVTKRIKDLKKGIKMCVATATAPHLLKVLMDKFKLEKYFPRVFSCNEVGHGKESPEVFLAAHEWLGGNKENTYVFEDSIVAIETSLNAGFKTVGIWDKYGFLTEKIEALSEFYIGEGSSLKSLIDNPKLF